MGTLGGAAIGGLMGHWLSRDKHKRERTWEKRTEAMGEMLQAIHRAQMKFRGVKRFYDEDPHRADACDDVRRLTSAAYDELRKAEAAFRANFLFFSPAFVALYERHQEEYDAIDDHLLPPDLIDAVAEHLDRVAVDLNAQAQRDVR
jgi:hypothetical protein